eukprot:UN04085
MIRADVIFHMLHVLSNCFQISCNHCNKYIASIND